VSARVTTRRFVAADAELGAGGEMRSSSLVRRLQETAVEASTEAGFPPEWYVGAGTTWLVRRSTIAFGEPIRAGETLEVRTWVDDFRRVRSIRRYEVRRADGALVAGATTDWVYLELATGRLLRVPEAMIAGFVPEGPVPSLPREPIALGAPSEAAVRTSRRVEPADLDALGHVNNAVYVDYVEAAVAAALAGRVLPPPLRAATHDVEYVAEARLGEELECVVWPVADGETACEIRHAADAAVLTRARSRWR
jgi:acyl-CoA thioester hydrolase